MGTTISCAQGHPNRPSLARHGRDRWRRQFPTHRQSCALFARATILSPFAAASLHCGGVNLERPVARAFNLPRLASPQGDSAEGREERR